MYDIALEHCGAVDAVMQIARINNISATANLLVGSYLLIPAVVNKKVIDYYQTENIYPANARDTNTILNGGIGYMQINTNFIVS